ncbi:helix-turn-helix domain-containing protein [Methylobacterium sp.]|uniref:helix-turn-helix domain-containing protein n=1 Tax=Methylobacterium sp. TaxID=409 RepID=UPI0025D5201F|nr:helix-turn-helix domain-containing protein [Methylobacterium sp.]
MTLAELASQPADVDHAKLDATTEDDIRRHMIEDGYDPDDPSYMEGAVVVRPPQMIRERLGMTQVEFAKLIDAPLATLKNWEQGRTAVPPYVRVLLNIIDREPEAALRALGLSRPLAA